MLWCFYYGCPDCDDPWCPDNRWSLRVINNLGSFFEFMETLDNPQMVSLVADFR